LVQNKAVQYHYETFADCEVKPLENNIM